MLGVDNEEWKQLAFGSASNSGPMTNSTNNRRLLETMVATWEQNNIQSIHILIKMASGIKMDSQNG